MTIERIARNHGTLRIAGPITDIRHRKPRRKLLDVAVAPLVGVGAGMILAVSVLTVAQVTISVIAATVDPQVSTW
ncbi:hypothetical protein SAMN05444339_11010 [Loktanella atrilutea]|uniref:Uncharacterized protein n=1 Tax=Loktanella atrilutea TaxID=366533 RepID=A0A1M5DIR8_LOKAT|nr:hypothetical protein [Loktanella atrilutea]SHF66887.1 hypothetical protein SAMN05444339_11010 [Loktanella atrilutea]